ncbi:UNVERIFIED_CONTAM: hypothetical protein FKN15_060951 [Acipenser sinensis]
MVEVAGPRPRRRAAQGGRRSNIGKSDDGNTDNVREAELLQGKENQGAKAGDTAEAAVQEAAESSTEVQTEAGEAETATAKQIEATSSLVENMSEEVEMEMEGIHAGEFKIPGKRTRKSNDGVVVKKWSMGEIPGKGHESTRQEVTSSNAGKQSIIRETRLTTRWSVTTASATEVESL